MNIPCEFFDRMEKFFNINKNILTKYYNEKPYKGIRINTLKASNNILLKLKYDIKKTPFDINSYYILSDESGLGKHPYHHAGAYYLQEPSASSAVCAMNIQPGEKILDLCAAPGGKSTQIAAYLNGKGLLWSNEYIKNRTQALLSNIERIGIRNAVISSIHPDILCNKLQGYFDKVLVDAPCSGEGMFRKEPQAILNWSIENINTCARRQLEILNSAAKAVKENGILVYSTCTFAPEENEICIDKFLTNNKNFELISCDLNFGRQGYTKFSDKYDMSLTRRILPLDGGEGHFIAVMKRIAPNYCSIAEYNYKNSKKDNIDKYNAEKLYNELFSNKITGTLAVFQDKIRLLPYNLPDLTGLGVVKAGVDFAEIKNNRIEPCHGIYMSAKPDEIYNYINLSCDDKRIYAFLRGEQIDIEQCNNGYCAVLVDNITVGFGKYSNGVLKNRYPKGLRNNI